MGDQTIKPTNSAAGDSLRTFLRYGVVGATQNGISYLASLGLVALGLAGWMATAIMFPLGVAFSFAMNRQWAFRDRKDGSFTRYVVLYALAYPAAMASVWSLEKIGAPAWLAILITMGVAAILLFMAVNLWVFPRSPNSATPRD